jgi:hypothetical protein
MNYILYAVPLLFLLIALALLVDRWRGFSTYRFADAINSLSADVLSTTVGLLTKVVGLLTYALAWLQWAVFELSASSLWVWVLAFFFYDCCYYWNQRLGMSKTYGGQRIRCSMSASTTLSIPRGGRPAPGLSSAGSSTCRWRWPACRR